MKSVARLEVSQFEPGQSFSFRGKRDRPDPGRPARGRLSLRQSIHSLPTLVRQLRSKPNRSAQCSRISNQVHAVRFEGTFAVYLLGVCPSTSAQPEPDAQRVENVRFRRNSQIECRCDPLAYSD